MLFNVIVYPKIFVQVVAEMLAIGYGLPKDAFTSLMKQVTYSTVQLVLYSCLLVGFGLFWLI